MSLFNTKEINQVAFIVHDIEKAAEHFAVLLGVPKPRYFLTGTSEISKVVYKGKPTPTRNKLIFMNTSGVQIELIEPDHEPGTMRDFLNETGEGIHHIAFDVDNIQTRMAALPNEEFSLLQTGEFTASRGRYTYIDSYDRYKTLVELLERDEPQPVLNPEPEQKNPLLGTDRLKQIAFVVYDLEKTLEAYCKLLGVEKPRVIQSGDPSVTKVEFTGKPTDGKSRYAFIDTPLIQIELIQPDLESPSTWTHHLKTYGEGVHHISFEVKNLDERQAVLEKMGYPLIQKGNFFNGKGKYAYMDTVSDYKVIIELLERYEI